MSLVENGVICFCVLKCCLVFPLGYLTSPWFNKIDVNTPQLWMSLRPEKQMPDGLCLVGHETGSTQERVRRHSSFGRNASEGDMARTGCGYKSTKERVPKEAQIWFENSSHECWGVVHFEPQGCNPVTLEGNSDVKSDLAVGKLIHI